MSAVQPGRPYGTGLKDTEWMDEALCAAWPHLGWVGDRQPGLPKLAQLADICDACGVRKSCAAYAIEISADLGMYAGIWLPLRSGTSPKGRAYTSSRWRKRLEKLEKICRTT